MQPRGDGARGKAKRAKKLLLMPRKSAAGGEAGWLGTYVCTYVCTYIQYSTYKKP
jgi:hypothetical protein